MKTDAEKALAPTSAHGLEDSPSVPQPVRPRAVSARRIDDLGRIVLPRELRRLYQLGTGALMTIEPFEDGILLRRAEETCELCGASPSEGLWRTDAGHLLCRACLRDAADHYARLVPVGRGQV